MQKIREAGFFDLIHVHSAPASAMASPLGMPLVYTSHWPESHSIGELFEALRAANSHFQLVAVSKRHSEILGKRYQPKVIYHGIDEGKFSLGSGRRRYAAFLGRFMKEKGVHIAIDVALQSRIPIRLAGVPIHDSDHRYYDREVKPRLSHRLATLVGEVGGKTKNGFLSHAIALLLPVNIEEAFGLVLVEAMLCGTPAIAFRRGAIPEIIDEGVTGWVVDTPKQMSDRLVQLSTDTDFDHERCRERAIERFSSARMVNNYIDLYRSILRRKS
jgi:glycosyltransferase involved in cell wall biosynthesis